MDNTPGIANDAASGGVLGAAAKQLWEAGRSSIAGGSKAAPSDECGVVSNPMLSTAPRIVPPAPYTYAGIPVPADVMQGGELNMLRWLCSHLADRLGQAADSIAKSNPGMVIDLIFDIVRGRVDQAAMESCAYPPEVQNSPVVKAVLALREEATNHRDELLKAEAIMDRTADALFQWMGKAVSPQTIDLTARNLVARVHLLEESHQRACTREADSQAEMMTVLGELAGAASMCWDPRPIGSFDSRLAQTFVDAAAQRLGVSKVLREEAKPPVPHVDRTVPTTRATSPEVHKLKAAIAERDAKLVQIDQENDRLIQQGNGLRKKLARKDWQLNNLEQKWQKAVEAAKLINDCCELPF